MQIAQVVAGTLFDVEACGSNPDVLINTIFGFQVGSCFEWMKSYAVAGCDPGAIVSLFSMQKQKQIPTYKELN